MTDSELAHQIASTAGQILLAIQRSGLFDGKAMGKAGDEVANAFIVAALKSRRPDDAILSEEAKDDHARLERKRVWIVDPLDGTREFGEARTDWAVHIALSIDGVASVGAVALPGLGLTLRSDAPPPLADAARPPRLLVSRTRPAAESEALAARIGGQLIGMGSAGAKAMAVVRGEAEIYLHSGGQYEWDNCAPVAVAQAAGLHVSRIDGTPLQYNMRDPYLPDLLICHRDQAASILELVSEILAASQTEDSYY